MAETQRATTSARLSTPPQARSSRFLSAPGQQPLTIPTPNARPLSNIGPLSPVNQNGSFAFDRIIKSGRIERRVKKKGAWKASWKSAYLVLRPNLLSIYKDENETELKVAVTMSDVTAVASVKKSNHENVFGIFTPSKNYHFSAATTRETSDWIAILRMESRTQDPEDLAPPNAGFTQGDQGYETTDVSAEEDFEPGSPEAAQWNVKGQKARMTSQSSFDPRRASGHPLYSGNESFATSQSDFSDGFGSSVPGSRGYLSGSIPVASPLTPIPDDTPTTSRPGLNRGLSHMSDIVSPSKAVLKQTATTTDSRIVRQGHLKLSRTISGVKQWKTIWMVLRINSLAFFKSSRDTIPLMTIPIISVIEAAEVERKKQNCFQVISEEKTYRFQAESEDELESWLGAFMSVLVKQEAERGKGSRHASVSQQQPQHNQSRLSTSRDGISVLNNSMRNVSLESHVGKRVVSNTQSTHLQTTTLQE